MTDETLGVGLSISPNDWQEAIIEQIEVATPTVKTFVLRPKVLHAFLPGQHIDVRLTAPDGYEAHRSYSVSSAPDSTDTLQLAIEELQSGEVSPYFHEVAVVGDAVEIRGPFTTHFVWRPTANGNVLLVGGGSGVAPLMSMVRHRTRTAAAHAAAAHSADVHSADMMLANTHSSDAPPMTLLYSARSWGDVIFRDELLMHEQQQSGLRVLFCITRDASNAPPARATDFTRRIDADLVRDVVALMGAKPDTCFVCGNNSFVGTVADALVDIGVAADHVKTERYGG
ncbi:MAG: FAD-binding oxidoreductase [Gemmatimonadaceae bacterium]